MGLVAAVVASIVTFGAASAAIGAVGGATEAASDAAVAAAAEGSGAMATAAAEAGGTLMAATAGASAGLANVVLSTAIAGMVSSMTSQVIGTGSINWAQVGESGLVSGLTAGLTNGITFNGTNGVGFTTGATTAADPSLASLASVQNIGSGLVPQAEAPIASNLPTEALALGADATISAGVQTAIEGGSFLNALKNDAVNDVAAVGAYAIGQADANGDFGTGTSGEAVYLAAHGLLGCAASAAEGTGCAAGALGGAASALIAPLVRDGLYDGSQTVTTTDNGDGTLTQTTSYDNPGINLTTVAVSMLTGGTIAGLLGQNPAAAATWAENEAQNNALTPKEIQVMNQAYGFAAAPVGSLSQTDVVNTLAQIQVALNDPNVTAQERLNLLSAQLTAYTAGIQSGVLSASNIGPLVSVAVASLAFSGGGEGPLPGGGTQSNVLPTTSGSRTATALGNATAEGLDFGTSSSSWNEATNTTGAAAVDSAIGSSSAGFANITNSGSRSLNLQGSGGMAGAQEFLNSLPVVPGSATTTANGAQVVTLRDGSTATLYPVSTSGGVPTIQIFRPNGAYSSTKIRF